MALRLRTNGAPLSGALFVSNPRKRKATKRRKARKRNGTKTGMARKTARKAYAKKNRRNTVASKARRAAALKSLRNRRNAAKKRSAAAKRGAATRRRNALALKANRRNLRNRRNKRNGTKKGMARKTARKAYVRKNRRNATKKGMVRTTARRAYTKRTNNAMTAFSGGKITGKLRRLVGKVPVVGTMASKFVAPLVVGAAAGAIHYYGVKAVQKFAPGVSTKIKPVQFTVAGSMVAAILMMGNKIPVLKKVPAKTRQQLAAASLVLGGGLDTYRWLSSTMGDLGEEVALYDYTGLGVDLGEEYALYDYTGLGVDLGDGMAYDVVPLPEDLGYGHAHFGDAMASPDDLSVEEGEAALAGPRHWCDRFGRCPVIRTSRGGMSPMAGRPGHRFGWLIKLIGFQRFQQLAAMPPGARVGLIAQMKQQAAALADQRIAAQSSGLGALGIDLGAAMTAGATL